MKLLEKRIGKRVYEIHVELNHVWEYFCLLPTLQWSRLNDDTCRDCYLHFTFLSFAMWLHTEKRDYDRPE